jgi:CheY-like chemotaxis protein
MVVEEILLELGHEVILAPDGLAALDLAEHHAFDLLVTDLAMPRMPGWELIPRLRATRPRLPVVVMTGFLPPGITGALEAAGPGPMVLLQKPFDLAALADAVVEVSAGLRCRSAGERVGVPSLR